MALNRKEFWLVKGAVLLVLSSLCLQGCYRQSNIQALAAYRALERAADSTESLVGVLEPIIEGAHRSESARLRDKYRHPAETLAFFQVQPEHTVVEIWPGEGWYTEILAPLLRNSGHYYAAGFALSLEETPQWRVKAQRRFNEKFDARPELFGLVTITELAIPERTVIAPPGTVDRVVSFRNVHNWLRGDYAGDMFAVFYRALKPGGLLGIVQHRAPDGTSLAESKRTGYVSEKRVIALAQAAGFQLLARSEINANLQDTRDHPDGVWSLPPTLRSCKALSSEAELACRRTYESIGESDRMTLKFIKPL